MCKSLLLSRLPYFHLLPTAAYRAVLRAFAEKPTRTESLIATKRTGIATAEFESLSQRLGYRILSQRFYAINPMYAYRFGVQPREQARWIAAHESLRDFVTTCAYYVLQPEPKA